MTMHDVLDAQFAPFLPQCSRCRAKLAFGRQRFNKARAGTALITSRTSPTSVGASRCSVLAASS
jgi:hypothetical protein